MTLLCIETSTTVCSAAVCKDGRLLEQCICREGSNHAQLLPRYVERLLAFARENGLSFDAVALSEGPGSYTGLRIGASTAKGLCYGLDVPLIPVSTLEVLCEAVKEKAAGIQPYDRLVPMIDARRMEVYAAVYDGRELGENQARAVVVENEDSLFSLSPKDGLSTLSEAVYYYFGDGAAKCRPVLTRPNWHFIPDIVPEAQYVGVSVENRKSKVKRLTANELAYYEPYYLKEFVAAQSHVKGLK